MNNIKRVRKSIPGKVARQLWVSSGGRCQYEGCNITLLKDSLTKRGLNKSYISHIVASSSNGPRGSKELSQTLETDISNLMLLCDECHNRIDEANVEEHTVEVLRSMKSNHERRIEFFTSLVPDKKTHIVLFGAKIGDVNSPLLFKNALDTVLPEYFPSESHPVELSLGQLGFNDDENIYWEIEALNLEKQFEKKIDHLRSNSSTQHYSIFGLAPQPLLIKLGTLFGDLYPCEVYQLHRDPSTWKWGEGEGDTLFHLQHSERESNIVALKIELSATISDDRIIEVLGNDVSIWSLKVDKPYNNFLRSKNQLQEFRKAARLALDKIKAIEGQNTELRIFPAMPISTSIEFGRIWMPKADMSMILYDQNKSKNGFFKTINILKK